MVRKRPNELDHSAIQFWKVYPINSQSVVSVSWDNKVLKHDEGSEHGNAIAFQSRSVTNQAGLWEELWKAGPSALTFEMLLIF